MEGDIKNISYRLYQNTYKSPTLDSAIAQIRGIEADVRLNIYIIFVYIGNYNLCNIKNIYNV